MALTRDDLWWTFSEALEQYLTMREMLKVGHFSAQAQNEARGTMLSAAEHMDVLTSPNRGNS